jgi:hypothetical protein
MAKMGESGLFLADKEQPLRTSEYATEFFTDIVNTSI